MGADLYIGSIVKPQRERYVTHYEHWIRVRDQATTEVERLQAQLRVNRFFDRMYAKGYFRDSYNEHNLLAKFGLTWWQDVGARLTVTGFLPPTQVRWLMQALEERKRTFWSMIVRDPDWASYWRRDRQLRAFLRQALQRNEAIECSL